MPKGKLRERGAPSSARSSLSVTVLSDDPALEELVRGLVAAGASCVRRGSAESLAPSSHALLVDDRLSDEVLHAKARELPAGSALLLLVARSDAAALRRVVELGADTLAPRTASAQEITSLLREHLSRRGEAAHAELPFAGFVGSSPWLDELSRTLPRLARAEASVLVTGETGTGKELVARALHRLSPRRGGPFVAVNCGALPEGLIEAELFGFEKGAFTGATHAKVGRFELAQGGTLLLDEVGELSEGAQVKLLRALQERAVERVGGTEPIPIDVRVIAATNRDLAPEQGRMRADLLFRLQVFSLHLAPLRDRKEDVIPLWKGFVEEHAARRGRPLQALSPSVSASLLAHDWPGNVRELQNAAHHAATLADDVIEREHLPPRISRLVEPSQERVQIPGMALKDLERVAIVETLRAAGSIRAASDILGISRRTIQYRLAEYREEGLIDGIGADDPSADELPHKRARVLLAEDDDDVRYAMEKLLTRAGYDVMAVASGSAVLERLGAALVLEQWQRAPDVIVTDVRMPGVTGMQLLEGMQKNGWRVPVVVITAFGDDELRARARALGATAFLDKPLEGPELEEAVADALRATAS